MFCNKNHENWSNSCGDIIKKVAPPPLPPPPHRLFLELLLKELRTPRVGEEKSWSLKLSYLASLVTIRI